MRYKVSSLLQTATACETQICGEWYPARPLNYTSIFNRLRDAWLVITGKADIVFWDGGQ